jgi:hypothetical protein
LKPKRYLKDVLYKSFAPFSRNSIILPDDYLQPLVEAARSHCYVENTGNKADSLHRRILLTYEEDIVAAYLKILTPLLKRQRIMNPMIAIDLTDEDFYGYFADPYLHPWTGEEGVESHWKFAVLSLVGKHKIPLLAMPVHLGMDKAEMVQQFLALAKKLFRRIRCILLDAGFYSGAVIEALKGERYLIRAPLKEKIQQRVDTTPQGSWKAWQYEVQWDGNRTRNKTSTTLVVVRNVKLRHTIVDCTYVTNMILDAGMDYVFLYCRRWQIETNFRMEDQVHIKSKSLRVMIRYFYFMISLLLHALWLLFWSGKIAFDAFKIRAANQFLFASVGIAYAYPVM